MKNTARIIFTIVVFFSAIAAVWMIPSAAVSNMAGGLILNDPNGLLSEPQQEPEGDKLVFGGSYTLKEGEILKGSLLVFGGTAQISEGSLVTGDAVVMGGTLTIDGVVEGEVFGIGGLIVLGPTAEIHGDVNTVSAKLDRAEGAVVDGTVNNVTAGPFSLIIPKNLQLPELNNPALSLPRNIHINPAWDALMVLIRSLIWAALAVLVALFVPKALDRVSGAAVGAPIASGGLGCLTILVVPLLLVLIAITICGIPISMIGFFLLVVAWGFGVIAIGAETGRRLAGLMKSDWALPVSAAVGVFILTLVADGIGILVPCIGWIISAFIGVIGLGAALLTRYGRQSYGIVEVSETPGAELIPPPSPASSNIEEVQPPDSHDIQS